MISRALREIGPAEVKDDDLSKIMPVVDQITLTLQKIARRKAAAGEEIDYYKFSSLYHQNNQ